MNVLIANCIISQRLPIWFSINLIDITVYGHPPLLHARPSSNTLIFNVPSVSPTSSTSTNAWYTSLIMMYISNHYNPIRRLLYGHILYPGICAMLIIGMVILNQSTNHSTSNQYSLTIIYIDASVYIPSGYIIPPAISSSPSHHH